MMCERNCIKVSVFIDDGYSGINQNRPAFQQMLDDMRRGLINTILVKDFSRLGRNYLAVSRYIEQVFPSLGVRFISLNDHFDSEKLEGVTAALDVPVKNLINAQYSRDISQKIKSALRTKKQQGILTSRFAIFGYRVVEMEKETASGNKPLATVIDEPAAWVVRRIFALAYDGLSSYHIAERLNTAHVCTPSAYKKQNGSKLCCKNAGRSLWTVAMIDGILRDERYTGTFVAYKRDTAVMGSGQKICRPKADWIKKPGAHPAIIPPGLFTAVTEKRSKQKQRSHQRSPNKVRALYQKVWCGKCGQRMRYVTYKTNGRYNCETARYTNPFGCMREYTGEGDLLAVIRFVVGEQIKYMFHGGDGRAGGQGGSVEQSDERMDKAAQKASAAKRLLYEAYKNGNLDKQTYIKKREALEHEALEYGAAHQEIQSSAPAKEVRAHDGVLNITDDWLKVTIGAVRLYGDKRIEILFVYRDEIALSGVSF